MATHRSDTTVFVFRFFEISVTQRDGRLLVHTPISVLGSVFALFLALVLLILLAQLTDNPFRAPRVGRALSFYGLKVVSSLLVLFGVAICVQSNDLTLDAKAHAATETNRYLLFKTSTTYPLSRIQEAEVDGSRNGGADRLSLVFNNGHVHPLTANNGKFGKHEAAAAINSYLAKAQ